MFRFFRKWRRKRRRRKPFPRAWVETIERNVPVYGRLSPESRKELQGHVQVFLAEKYFEGCGGLELNDEIRVTIAAQACVLLLGRDTEYFSEIISILVYPRAYVAPHKQHHAGHVVTERKSARLGEASTLGNVVLSWDDVRHGAGDPDDGFNLVLHEFAHQLDLEGGAFDGAPLLENRGSYSSWARVLGHEYEQLKHADRRGRATVLDPYGATDPAEFFAVATECFFESPHALAHKHPELYEELRSYYRQDPALWAWDDETP